MTRETRRVTLGLVGVALCVAAARRDRVSEEEARMFRAVNRLPDGLARPAWVVMQLGTLGAAPVAAVVAATAGRRVLARRLLAGGVVTWLLSKVVKRAVRRPRPARLLADVRVRGRAQTGLGFLSGHAGVAVALATAAGPELGGAGRAAVITGAAAVSLARLYVGAHLPLDVLGGAALGLAVQGTIDSIGS